MDFSLTLLLLAGIVLSMPTMWLWADQRQMARRPIDPLVAREFKALAYASWTVNAADAAAAARVEARHRLQRVRRVAWGNFKIATALLLLGLVIIYLTSPGRYSLNGFVDVSARSAIRVYGIMAFVTLFAALDVLGGRSLAALLGRVPAEPYRVHISREGVLWDPGGLRRFRFKVRRVDQLDSTPHMLVLRIGPEMFHDDCYVPVPRGKELDAQKLIERL